jgi:hypothetical protein
MAGHDPGCVKMLEAVIDAQQKDRNCALCCVNGVLGESILRQNTFENGFSHSQDPK